MIKFLRFLQYPPFFSCQVVTGDNNLKLDMLLIYFMQILLSFHFCVGSQVLFYFCFMVFIFYFFVQIDPSERLDPEVEDILVDLAEEFVESVSS